MTVASSSRPLIRTSLRVRYLIPEKPHAGACGHNDIDYIDKFRGKTGVQVKAHIMLRLNNVTKKKKERDGEENDIDNEDEGKNKKEYNPTQRSR